ncbi:MAG: hypothetical protein KDK91_07070 [Gammaproteobacteria bacterium]|nr:hypothetical protein [Gammaproteobacteria bacterium]
MSGGTAARAHVQPFLMAWVGDPDCRPWPRVHGSRTMASFVFTIPVALAPVPCGEGDYDDNEDHLDQSTEATPVPDAR